MAKKVEDKFVGGKIETKNKTSKAEIAKKDLKEKFEPATIDIDIPVAKGEMPWGPGNIAKGIKALSKGSKVLDGKAGKSVDSVSGSSKISNGTGELNKDSAKAYLRDIEAKTGLKVNKEQIHLIKEALRNNNYEKLTPKETAKHRGKFTSSLKDKLIAEWEEKTNQKWPRYTEEVFNKNGEVARGIGQPYDAHHIIENNFGGPHEWWNIHHAKYPMNIKRGYMEKEHRQENYFQGGKIVYG